MRISVHRFAKIYFFSLITLISNNLAAQNNRIYPQNFVSSEERAKLINLSERLDREFHINKKLAYDRAKIQKWVTRQVDSNGAITELMGLDPNGIPIYYSTGNAAAARTIRTNQVYPGAGYGLNLTGKYYTVGIWDGGAVRISHREFGGRVTYKDTVRTVESHPTHVAGTMVAAGRNSNAKGMAYEANLWAYSWDNDLSEMTKAASQGLLISNHSYGQMWGWQYNDVKSEWSWYGDTTISETTDYHFGFYDNESKYLDELAFTSRGYLMVYAAHNVRGVEPPTLNTKHRVYFGGSSFLSTKTRNSNNNFDCLNGKGVAKNVLTVGAVNAVGYYSKPSDVVMSGFSAWGPTDDGRIKPDIVGDGVGVYSSEFESDSAYGYKSGTSMATPSVSGSLLLVQQQYNMNTGNSLSSAALKAVAIHTADEAGPNPGPDYMFGWGLMNTKKAVDVINNVGGNHTIKNGILFKNTKLDYALPADGKSAYRITIVWTDPAGTVSAPSLNNRTPKLVNDLDIRVVDPEDGETFYPWRLDPNNPAAAATKGDNFRDNVEVIDIPYLPEIDYVVRVSHKGQLANNQSFTVIISKLPIVIPELYISSNNSGVICPGKQVEFNQIEPDNFFTKYVWSFPGGAPSSFVGKTPPKITYNTPGQYDVLLVASNEYFTRTFRKRDKIVVTESTPGSVVLKQNCASSYTNVTADTTGKFTVKSMNWSVNNILVQTTNGMSSLDGSKFKNGDVVKAIILASSSCAANYNIISNSIVINKPAAIIPNVSIASNSIYFCNDNKSEIFANATNTTANGIYQWHIDGNFFYSNTDNSFPIGVYYGSMKDTTKIFCVYVNYNYCSDTKTDTSETITFYKSNVIAPTLFINTAKTKICNGEWVEIIGTTNVPEFGRQAMWYLNGQPYGEGFGTMGFTLKNGDKVYCKITSTNPCLSKSEIISNEITFIGKDMLYPTLSIRATKTSICENEVVTFFAEGTDKGPNPTYNWYHNLRLVKSSSESTFTINNLADQDEIRCVLNPNQCSYNEVTPSNNIIMSVRGRNDSKLTITADDTTVCEGTPVRFTAVLTKPGFSPSYFWRVNGLDVHSSSDNFYVANNLSNGDIVDCYVNQSTGCINITPYSNPVKISVFETGPPTVNINPITPVCSGKAITFEATATMATPTTNYQWNVNGSMKQNSRSSQFTSTELKSGDFVNCIMFTNAECATSNTGASMYYQVSLKTGYQDEISIENLNFKVCENEPVEFVMYGAYHEPGSLYQWKINDEVVETFDIRQNFSTTALKNNDVVSATFISSNECLDQKEYTSNEIPIAITTANPTISIASTLMCKGSPITFYATSTNVPKGSLYYWKKNGSYEDTGEDSTYTPPYFNSGDKISCTLIPKGCTPEDEYYSNEIIINQADIQPEISIVAEGMICPGTFTTFKVITRDEGESPTYIWYRNGQLIFADRYPTISLSTFAEGDELTCTLLSSEPCALGKPVSSVPFVIHTSTPVNVNLQLTTQYAQVCQGQEQNFSTTVSVPQNQLTYHWFVNNIEVENASAPTWSSSTLAPDDRVTCLVQSDKICLNSTTTSQTVSSNVAEITYPVFSIQGVSPTFCAGQPAEFTAETFDAGMNPVFEWFVNDISVQKGTDNTFSSSLLKDGDILICHLIPKGICIQDTFNVSNELIVNIIETEASTIVIKKISTIICEDGLAEFQADATYAGANPIYEWRVNNIVVQSGDNYNFSTNTLKNADIVSCKLIRNDDCSGQQTFESNKITIQTEPRRTPTIAISTTQENYCNGTPVQITTLPTFGGNKPYYSWYLNDLLVYYSDTNLLDLNTPIDGDIIYCVMNSSAECVTSNEIRSNDIVLNITNAVTPSVSISASNTVICGGQTIQFTATATHGGTNPVYEWKINGNPVQKNNSNTFISNALKNGDIVHCILENNELCANQTTSVSNDIAIEVIQVQAPTISITTSNNNSCQGETIRFTATYTHAEQAEFIWKVNGQEVKKGAENTFESNTLKNGDVVISEMKSVSACSVEPIVTISNSIEIKTISNVTPSIKISADDIEVCSGTTVNFTAVITNGGDHPVIVWKVNNIITRTGSSTSFSTNAIQNGDVVTAILQSDAPCITVAEVTSLPVRISVIRSVKPSVKISASSTSVCTGEEVIFTAIAENIYGNPVFEWKVNGTTVQKSSIDIFTSVRLQNQDKVSCTLHVSNPCSLVAEVNSNPILMSVLPPVQPTVELRHNYDTICPDTDITLELTLTNISSGTRYSWYRNGALAGSEDELTIGQLVTGDEIWCSISTKATNCDITMYAVSDTFTANVYSGTEFEVYQRGDTLFATAGYLAYNWYFNDKLIAKGLNNYIVPEYAGNYTVNITDPNGCAGVSRTINFVFTSVKNQAKTTFRMYPNPTDGKIQIEFSNPQSGIISIYHINGQLILQPTEIHHLKNYSLDISNYPEGMYIITFEQADSKWSEKIIKMQ